ncbi:acyltransferase family protein [Roseiterribacter gracilis]|uniref:Acyltransferase n=1 Tax=Roseiterribacter gracilis TaxID=2812848 RepID=A0A8S8X8B2_9PROT|nr:acyltransferase [Rhodospirillales bacterium TMPK1]
MSTDTKTGHLNALTGLRGIAAWWVALYHFRFEFPAGMPDWALPLVSRGYLAVDLFFILSGFILALNYANKVGTLESGTVRAFLIARVARIWPLHAVMSVLFLINPIAILFFSTQKSLAGRYPFDHWVMGLFLVQNWGFTTKMDWNVPAWSISTEWAAYLLFPLLVAFAWRVARTRFAAAVGVITMLILTALVFNALGARSVDHDIPKYGLVRCLLEFTTGLFLYRAWSLGRVVPMVHVALALVAACAIAAFAMGAGPDWLFLPTAFVATIVLLATGKGPARILAWGPILFLGEISYSTYLAHWFVRDWTKFLVMDHYGATLPLFVFLGATFVASVALFYGVEKPGRSWMRKALTKRIGGVSPVPTPRIEVDPAV